MKRKLLLATAVVLFAQTAAQAQTTTTFNVNIAGMLSPTAAAATASTNAEVAAIDNGLALLQAMGLVTAWGKVVNVNGPPAQVGMGVPPLWYHEYDADYTVTWAAIKIPPIPLPWPF